MKNVILIAIIAFSMNAFSQVSKTINITAGNLSNALTVNEKSAITNLTITGTIDARDFKTMRDDMPLLAELDLSGVTIAEYIGTKGTFDTNSKIYPANSIPARAFYDTNIYAGKPNFKLIVLPENLIEIGEWAFLNLTKLTVVEIPSSVTSIGKLAFSGASCYINVQSENPNFSSLDGVLFNKLKTTLIQCPISKSGNYEIPSTVNTIGIFAFSGCSDLTSVQVPSSVRRIEGDAFVECKRLTSINIPTSVTFIGYQAFQGCKSLISIVIPYSVITIDWWAFAGSSGLFEVDGNNPNYSSFEGILYNKDKSELIQCPVSKSGILVIDSSVKVVGGASFMDCSKLSSVSIPSTVDSIGEAAFWTCSGLTSIYIHCLNPIDLSLSSSTFVNVSKTNCKLNVPFGSKSKYEIANQWKDFLNIVEMPGFKLSKASATIGSSAGSETSIEISSNVTWTTKSDQQWLEVSPSTGNGSLQKLTFKAIESNTSSDTRNAKVIISSSGVESQTVFITQASSNEPIIVTAGELKNQLSSNELASITNLTLSGIIDARDFKTMRDDMPLLAELDLSGVTVAAYSGQEGTAGTSYINYPANEIPERAFCTLNNVGKKSLITIKFPISITSIGKWAHYSCTGISSVIIPKSVSTIKRSAFNWCISMNSLIFESPASLKSIDTLAFYGCSKLNLITIPSEVKNIGYLAFINSNAIISVDANNLNYSSINGVLLNKEQTQLIYCPQDISGTFNIPTTVTTIDELAFFNCTKLSIITIPHGVKTIFDWAFERCSGLTSISIPSSINRIGESAFNNCIGLNSIYCYSIKPVNLSSSKEVFYNVNKNACKLYVPRGSASDYQSAYQWNEFTNIIEMPGFTFSSNSVKIEAEKGSKASVDISSDVDWKASSDQSWLTVSPASGSGNGKLTFTATANTTNTIRSAKVTVSSAGAELRTISVVQSYILQSSITKLYDFDCQYPYTFANLDRLVSDGIYLYGIMEELSVEGKINLIRIKPDGSDFTVLHSFDFFENIVLTYSGNKLFGTASSYRGNSFIFKIDTNGLNYTKLNSFKHTQKFNSPLVISNNTIYGSITDWSIGETTNELFKANTDGTGYSIIFTSGKYAFRDIVLTGNSIVGNDYYTIIKVNTDGSGFIDYKIESDIPVNINNDRIFGLQKGYGDINGNIFKMNVDGTSFTKIKEFDSSYFLNSQHNALTIIDNTLYGLPEDDNGFFKINTDGTGFSKIHIDFKLSQYPTSAELTLIGKELFGSTSGDGLTGEIFKINTLDDSFTRVFKFGKSASGAYPLSTLVESGNFLYGNTYSGGSYEMGTIFRINKDGSNFVKLFDFKDKETGVLPTGQLTLIGSTLFGTTSGGFSEIDYGNIYKINVDGTGHTILHEFDLTNGANPNGSLIFHKGHLYGITLSGGKENHGVVFKINLDGTGFAKISDNTDLDTGENSYNGITVSDDDVIYGVTAVDYEGVFRLNTDGTGLKKIFEMNYESGGISYCKPLLINDELYIATSEYGANAMGTIFKIKTDGTGFTILYNFEGIDDNSDADLCSNSSLLLHNGFLYGTANNVINKHGYLYKINLDGTGFTKLSDFNGEKGSIPYLCDLIIDDKEDIYGLTTFGGKYSGGIIYKYSLEEPSTSVQDITDKTQVQIFPNPTNGKLQLRFDQVPESETWITVHDIYGEIILKAQVFNKEENINLIGKSPGLYLIKVDSGKSNRTYKIVLE